jgi:hypothetical protein
MISARSSRSLASGYSGPRGFGHVDFGSRGKGACDARPRGCDAGVTEYAFDINDVTLVTLSRMDTHAGARARAHTYGTCVTGVTSVTYT